MKCVKGWDLSRDVYDTDGTGIKFLNLLPNAVQSLAIYVDGAPDSDPWNPQISVLGFPGFPLEVDISPEMSLSILHNYIAR